MNRYVSPQKWYFYIVMCRDTVQIPGRNRETLVRVRFWSRVLFDVTAMFQGNFIKPKAIGI